MNVECLKTHSCLNSHKFPDAMRVECWKTLEPTCVLIFHARGNSKSKPMRNVSGSIREQMKTLVQFKGRSANGKTSIENFSLLFEGEICTAVAEVIIEGKFPIVRSCSCMITSRLPFVLKLQRLKDEFCFQ